MSAGSGDLPHRQIPPRGRRLEMAIMKRLVFAGQSVVTVRDVAADMPCAVTCGDGVLVSILDVVAGHRP